MTLTLKDTTDADGIKVTVDTDTEAILENIEAFVEQMNTVRSKILELTKYDSTTEEGSILTGNYGVQIVSQQLKDIIASGGIGFEDYDEDSGLGDRYTTLSQLGIVTDTDQSSATCGLLIFDDSFLDEDLLATALQEDPEGVAMLFSADLIGQSKSAEVTFMSLVDGTTQAGHYDVSYTIENGEITEAYINGNRASISGNWEITGAAGKPESGMAIRIEDRTDGTHTADVDIKEGKIPQLRAALDELTDGDTGTLNIIADNYQDIIDGLDDKIALEEDRLELKEQRLKEQYAGWSPCSKPTATCRASWRARSPSSTTEGGRNFLQTGNDGKNLPGGGRPAAARETAAALSFQAQTGRNARRRTVAWCFRLRTVCSATHRSFETSATARPLSKMRRMT